MLARKVSDRAGHVRLYRADRAGCDLGFGAAVDRALGSVD